MTDNTQSSSKPDWSQLAKDALDIWQNHLTSLATDPKAKEEMARLVTPMTEAMAGWSSVMQQSMHQMMKMAAAAAEQAQSYEADAPQTANTEEASAPETEENLSDQQVVTEESAPHDESVSAEPVLDEPEPVLVSLPVDEPAVAPAGDEYKTARGRTSSADGSRSLAELAGRLASLERELDQLRPRTRRKEPDAEPVADGSDSKLAGTDPGPHSA